METLIYQCLRCLGVDEYDVYRVLSDGSIVRLRYCPSCHERMEYIGSC